MSDGTVRVEPHILAAGKVGPFVYAAKVAVDYRPSDGTLAGTSLGSDLLFSASAGIKVLSDRLVVGPEIFGSTVITSASSKDTPFEGILGAHYAFVRDFRVGGGVGPGLSHGDGAPAVRGLVSLEWAPAYEQIRAPASALDRDHDGVADAGDACPDVAGMPTNDPKTNGCPADRDHDGVADAEDACPDVAGMPTNDPKTNGCPADRDHDGVADAEDACPDVAGVHANDPKTNGCPADRDHDGIADAEDACPDMAGVRTNDPKTNGCPADRDQDGIADAEDACPDDAGPRDPDPKRNGCPRAVVTGGQIRILDQIKFRFNSADLDPASDPILAAVRSIMDSHADIGKLRIEGHTDNRGASDYNRTLSARRAASVAAWLNAHGIASSRLTSTGFGSQHPIVSNDAEDGRRQNRRVEFHIVASQE